MMKNRTPPTHFASEVVGKLPEFGHQKYSKRIGIQYRKGLVRVWLLKQSYSFFEECLRRLRPMFPKFLNQRRKASKGSKQHDVVLYTTQQIYTISLLYQNCISFSIWYALLVASRPWGHQKYTSTTLEENAFSKLSTCRRPFWKDVALYLLFWCSYGHTAWLEGFFFSWFPPFWVPFWAPKISATQPTGVWCGAPVGR